ncbi:cell wall-binding protein [Lacrimispora xylanisolvens]|uniref:cell wall-binding protein n=1 Tax=Lacrimispora xylanisolvens TaxID=384636 RepID=UPI002402A975
MRKQTKLVAVLSTAALLALGASMSSFAATGWQEENGTWVYYDKSGDKVEDKWEKSGDNWFYLDGNGEMSTDLIVEYNDNYYYVDDNGSMVTNKWVSVENSDFDGSDENEPANHWYYFGSNGKAYKGASGSSTASFKTINGKKYIFDNEGKMLYGWIAADGQRDTTDDAWRAGNGVYYCGDENDGAQAIGWSYLHIKDTQWDGSQEIGASSKNVFDDEDQDRWFYFKSNGKKMENKNGETINGKKYSFDEDGRMNAEWVNWSATPTYSTVATPGITATYGSAAYTEGFRYYGSPEDGARRTKGWFQVVPDSYLDDGDYSDDSENWYYGDKDGKLVASELKTINGKKYAFNEKGVMLDGFRFIKLDTDNKTIVSIQKKDTSNAPAAANQLVSGIDASDFKFDTIDGFKKHASSWEKEGYKLYYFGGGEDGSMKTGKQNIAIDGDNASFLFNKSGSFKGSGKTGIDNKKYYQSGMLMAADKEDKYAVVKINKSGDNVTHVTLLTTDEFIRALGVSSSVADTSKYSEDFNLTSKIATEKLANVEYRLVNTSGAVQKSKTKVKDGNDRCYTVGSDGTISRVYTEN